MRLRRVKKNNRFILPTPNGFATSESAREVSFFRYRRQSRHNRQMGVSAADIISVVRDTSLFLLERPSNLPV